MRKLKSFCAVFFIILLFTRHSSAQITLPAQTTIDSNVVFGMYSGLALLMNVYKPQKPNGYGVIYVPGSGFHTPLSYSAPPITKWINPWVPALVNAGYTVFVINHRTAPRFRHPVAIEDVQRAIRFVRYSATRWNINPDRIGIGGYSSGGTLSTLAGMLGSSKNEESEDPVERFTAKVSCVMSGGAAYDFTTLQTQGVSQIVGSYLGMTINLGYSKGGEEYQEYKNASPLYQVSSGDANLLMIHGDADDLLPLSQARSMDSACRKAGVNSQLIIIPGGTHGKLNSPGAPDYLNIMVKWFDNCLKGKNE
jgi:acetyl esterase/lipase